MNITFGNGLGILSMMATFGALKEFDPENEKVSAYLELVEMYFPANDITERRVPIFISVIGGKTYSLLWDLLAPANPKEKSFDELAEVLK